VVILSTSACKKDQIEPDNPFDKIDYGDETPSPDTLNAITLAGLHRNLFVTKCAVPGCHDGAFEPDFRTVQSTYSTLVYAPIVKNNEANEFTYRVIPFDTAKSVLYERITNCCFVNTDDRMPQDNIGTGLPQADIDKVAQWILQGAKNLSGEIASRPDLEPNFSLYYAANSTYTVEFSAIENRVDSLIFNPFKIPSGEASFAFAAAVTDDITPISELQYNKLYISDQKDVFTSAIQFQGTLVNIPGQGPLWIVSIPLTGLTPGVQYFMRYYTNDGQHANNTEFPQNSTVDPYKTYWSFIIQP
jgi:hypothetical protein